MRQDLERLQHLIAVSPAGGPQGRRAPNSCREAIFGRPGFARWRGFRDGQLAHEHIYRDQASVLKHLLTDPSLPVRGVESAKKVAAGAKAAPKIG